MTRNEALQLMGLNENYLEVELKKNYRKLAKQHHPDMNGGDDTRFKQVALAYDILTGKREADTELFSGMSSQPRYRRRQPNTTFTHTSIFNFEPVGG